MQLLRLTVIAVAVVLCTATSAPRYRYPRNYPMWRAAGPATQITACAEIEAWVAKSGKQGVGVTVRLTGRGERACRAEIASARLVIGGDEVAAAALPESAVVQPGATAHMYVPFAFDNEAAWNRGDRRGELAIGLRFDGASAAELRVALEHARGKPHLKVDRYQPRVPPPAPAPGNERAK